MVCIVCTIFNTLVRIETTTQLPGVDPGGLWALETPLNGKTSTSNNYFNRH